MTAMLPRFTFGLALLTGTSIWSQEPDAPSPFAPVESNLVADATPATSVRFTETPRPSVSVSKSRTHYRRGDIDPAGQRRLSSALIGTKVRLKDGEDAGVIRDLVLGANGAVEFLVGELDEMTYLLPYDVQTEDRDDRSMTLALSVDEFVNVPGFAGRRSNLKMSEYRDRLMSAVDRAEETWGLVQISREHSVAKPIVEATPSTSTPTTAGGNATGAAAPGLPVLAEPQAAPATPVRQQTVIVQPQAPQTGAQPQGQNNGSVGAPVGTLPIGGFGNARFTGNSSRFNNVNSGRAGQVGGATTGTGNLAPTNPSATRFPGISSPPRSGAGSIGGVSPAPPGTAGGANTIGGPNPPQNQPATNAPNGGTTNTGSATVPLPPQTSVPGMSTPPPAGTTTQSSPSGTRYPTRIP